MKPNIKNKIIESSIELFSEKNYSTVSIAEICRKAGVSNGIFYTYFKDKTSLFCFLLQETSDRINKYFQNITGDTIYDRLKSFIDINLFLTKKEFKLIKIYRKGQYKFLQYENNLRLVYNEALEKVYGRNINKYEHFFLMSGIRYINIYYISNNLFVDTDFLAKILMNGLSEPIKLTVKDLDDSSFYLRVPFNSSNIRCSFLNCGLEILKTTSFSNFRIQDLVEKSKLSTGTFYNYFSDKEEFLKIILLRTRKQVFYFLKDNYREGYPVLDNFLTFMYLIFEYYKDSPFKYSLMRELEEIYPNLYANFVEEDINFYIKNLLNDLFFNFQKKKLISVLFLGYSHYMGIDFFYTNNFSDRNKFFETLMFYIQNGIEK